MVLPSSLICVYNLPFTEDGSPYVSTEHSGFPLNFLVYVWFNRFSLNSLTLKSSIRSKNR